MKKTDFATMSDDDLRNRLKENIEEIESAKMKFRMGQFKRTSEFPRLRKDVARLKTALTQRALKAGAGK